MGGPHSVSRTQHPDTDLRASIKVVGEECLMKQTDASGTVRYQHYRIDSTHEETTTSRNSEPGGPRQRKNQIENPDLKPSTNHANKAPRAQHLSNFFVEDSWCS